MRRLQYFIARLLSKEAATGEGQDNLLNPHDEVIDPGPAYVVDPERMRRNVAPYMGPAVNSPMNPVAQGFLAGKYRRYMGPAVNSPMNPVNQGRLFNRYRRYMGPAVNSPMNPVNQGRMFNKGVNKLRKQMTGQG